MITVFYNPKSSRINERRETILKKTGKEKATGASLTFDAPAYYEKLRGAGVPEEEAKGWATALKDVFAGRMVAREYLDARLKELELRLKYDLIVRLGGIVVACAALILGGLPLILKFFGN